MRQAQITVLERLRNIEEDFMTEPFETSWAGEAMVMRGDEEVKYIQLRHFAGALRFSCRISYGARFKLTLQLHLKE